MTVFNPKVWYDAPNPLTPLNAAALNDLEARIAPLASTIINAGGAAGNGSPGSAGAPLQALIDSAPDGSTIHLTSQVYDIGATVLDIGGRNMAFEGEPGTVIKYTVEVFQNWGFLNSTRTLSADNGAGNNAFALTSATGVVRGDWLTVTSTVEWPLAPGYGASKGEWVRVASISGNTITIDGHTEDSYTAATTSVKQYIMPTTRVSGIHFIKTNPDVGSGATISLMFNLAPQIVNCTFEDNVGGGIDLHECVGFNVDRCRFINGSKTGAVPFGYGIDAISSHGGVVSNCHHNNGHGLFTTAGGSTGAPKPVPRHITIANCVAYGTADNPFHSHEASQYLHFFGCSAVGHAHTSNAYGEGFLLAGVDLIVENCVADGIFGSSFQLGGQRNTLIGCVAKNGSYNDTPDSQGAGIRLVGSSTANNRVIGCLVENMTSVLAGIRVESGGGYLIKDCSVIGMGSRPGVYIESGSVGKTVIEGCYFKTCGSGVYINGTNDVHSVINCTGDGSGSYCVFFANMTTPRDQIANLTVSGGILTSTNQVGALIGTPSVIS